MTRRRTGPIRYVDARPIHQFLEHECVVALFDDLVSGIPEFRRPVRQHGNVLHETTNEHLLELQTHLGDVRLPILPYGNLLLPGAREIPRMCSQQFYLGKNPSWVVVHELEIPVPPNRCRYTESRSSGAQKHPRVD